ncbi:MAG: hypothetical protein ACOVOD_07405, partial [Rhodoferax sp.]
MTDATGFATTLPDPLIHTLPRPANMAAMLQRLDDLRAAPIVTLGLALEQLGVLDKRQLEDLR